MSDNNHTVTLRNGSKVSWKEFSRWSFKKQKYNLEKIEGLFTGSESEIRRQFECRKKANSEGRNWALSGGKQSLARKVLTPKGVCQTITEAAKLYSVDGGTIRNWINRGKTGFYFLTPAKLGYSSNAKVGRVSGEANPSSRAVLSPRGRFPTLISAARAFGVGGGTMREWIKKSKSDQFRYENDVNNHAIHEKIIVTPEGRFSTLREAANHFGMSTQGMRGRLKSKTWVDFFYE